MKLGLQITIDEELYEKLNKIYVIRKFFLRDKEHSKSRLINTALKEYFENHADEYEAMMREYREKGGWLEL